MSRGRGRGSAKGITNIEALGIKSRDAIPPPLLHPPPLFPPLERKPLELKNDETTRNILTCKKDYESQIRNSPFYIRPSVRREVNVIAKYSDRYKTSHVNDITELLNSIPNWKMFMPKELHFAKRKVIKPKKPSTDIKDKLHSTTEISERLNQLEKKEQVLQQVAAESEDDEGVKTDLEEYYDEEIEEEEGDYQQSYFDPGDEFGVDEDDALDDGPSY